MPTPTATITVNRNRLKTYGNAVYMKSGTNYEIELYNPMSSRVLATIEVDGKLISSKGIVLKPGQRVYLERWIDEPKKFMFSTYEVEKTPEVMNAIANNGRVRVLFYQESSTTTFTATPNSFTGNLYYSNANLTVGNFPSSFSTGSVNVKSCISTSDNFHLGSVCSTSIETGMSEKGDNSFQNLESTSGAFNTWTVSTAETQILPESQKPIEMEKIRSYCTGCGTRVRASSWKFCPSCGEKL